MSDSVIKEVEEALVETAKEADRQKKFVERQSDNVQQDTRPSLTARVSRGTVFVTENISM